MVEFKVVAYSGPEKGKNYDLPLDYRIDGKASLLKDIEAAFGGKITWLKSGASDSINKRISG